jgi:hypothetical protein
VFAGVPVLRMACRQQQQAQQQRPRRCRAQPHAVVAPCSRWPKRTDDQAFDDSKAIIVWLLVEVVARREAENLVLLRLRSCIVSNCAREVC